jgi:hypothetical protein
VQELFDRYTKLELHYAYTSGPNLVQTIEDAQMHGLNCGALAHLLIYELFGYRLPWQLMCVELFHDDTHFLRLFPFTDLEVGDILFVGREGAHEGLQTFQPMRNVDGTFANWNEHPRFHLAVCIDNTYYDDCRLIHISPRSQGVEITHIHAFQATKQYRRIHGVRRLKSELRQRGP